MMKFDLKIKKMKIGSSRPSTELTKSISKLMYDNTMQRFDNEDPGWTPLN